MASGEKEIIRARRRCEMPIEEHVEHDFIVLESN